MPFKLEILTSALVSNLSGVGVIGQSAPLFATGVAIGVMMWTPQIVVTTADVGTAGAGTGTLPCIIPQPLLLGGLQTGMASFNNIGQFAASIALGLANGLASAYPSALITTVNPSVGVGTGVAKFAGPSAIPSLIGGFASAGMTGMWVANIASAIGLGLDIAFAGFTVPVPIVGPPSTSPSSGSGTGTIV